MLNSMDFFNLSRANLWDSCSQNHISRVSFKLLSKLKIVLNYDQASAKCIMMNELHTKQFTIIVFLLFLLYSYLYIYDVFYAYYFHKIWPWITLEIYQILLIWYCTEVSVFRDKDCRWYNSFKFTKEANKGNIHSIIPLSATILLF
jgi:hypothetical protein